MEKTTVTFILILSSALAAFAYMHANFATKDAMAIVLERLNRIEGKLDHCRNRADTWKGLEVLNRSTDEGFSNGRNN